MLEEFLGRAEAGSWSAVLASPTHLVVIADGTEGPVGFLTASERRVARYPAPIAEIDELYVRSSTRRTGAGCALVASARSWAATRGCDRLFVATNLGRPESLPFYRSVGFDHYGAHLRTRV